MSTTSGPIVPDSTGNSSEVPSGSFSVAFLSMARSLGGAQALDGFLQDLIVALAAADDDVPQVVVGKVQQRRRNRLGVLFQIALQDDVQLQQPAPAAPPEPVVLE